MTASDSGIYGIPRPAPSHVLPEPDPDSGRLWYAIQTKSRQEKSLTDHMRAKQITAYLPLVPKVRTYGKVQKKSDLPLFPGYVFLYGEKTEVYEADRTRHVARYIEITDQAGFYRELDSIHKASLAGHKLDPYPGLKVGMQVEVRAGPLKGVQGVIEARTKEITRLFIVIEILGRSASLEIDGSLLEPA